MGKKMSLDKLIIPSFLIMMLLAVSIAVLPNMFGSIDNAANENNISTSAYADTYETGTTLNLYLIYFLEACLFAFFLLFVVGIVDHFKG